MLGPQGRDQFGVRRGVGPADAEGAIELYRQALLGGRPALVPGTAALAVIAAVLLCAGLWLFGRLKPAFVDEI